MRTLVIKAVIISGLCTGVTRLLPGRAVPKDKRELALIKAAKAGDRVAFDALIEEHSDALRRFLARRVNTRDLEDIFQETWLAAWEHFGRYSGAGRFRTWLFAVSIHKVQDYWRQAERHPVSPAPDDLDQRVSYIQSDYSSVELRESVRQAWNSLTANQQELLELYYGSEFTLAEIAKLLGRNLNTVKYQFYRAHEDAASHLSPELLQTIHVGEVRK